MAYMDYADDPERIVGYGPQGSGKTRAWFSIIHWLWTSGQRDFRCHAIDTDLTVQRFLHSADFSHLSEKNGGPILHYPCWGWEECRDASKKVQRAAQPGDWVVIDMGYSFWEWVQDYFLTQVHGDIDKYFLQVRMEMTRDDKSLYSEIFQNNKDWPTINRMYRAVWQPLVKATPAHLFIATTAESVGKKDDKAVKELYGAIGFKPGGQKHMGHQAHTNLIFSHDDDGWYVSTIKDRERRMLDHQPVPGLAAGFAYLYLLGVAQWRL